MTNSKKLKAVTNKMLAQKLYTHCNENPNAWSTENIRWAWKQIFIDLNGELDRRVRYFRLSEDRYDEILGFGLQLAEAKRNEPSPEQKEINILKEQINTLTKLVAALVDRGPKFQQTVDGLMKELTLW